MLNFSISFILSHHILDWIQWKIRKSVSSFCKGYDRYPFTNKHLIFILTSFRTTSVDHNGIDSSVPLKFEDIVDEKTYDKMRPPKPGGKL